MVILNLNFTGCTSVQCIVADLIPRYASKCPTALEAAAKVVINMYNWSMAIIKRGEDADGVAFQTAKSCVLGLADICCTASSVAPTSSVIRGICSAVFQNVLTFFISSCEGRDVFLIVGKETMRIQDSSQNFSELKQKVLDENESSSIKLSKLCALSLIWILFSYPQKLLAAWFELFKSSASDGVLKGQYFLRQMTSRLDNDGGYPFGKTGDESKSSTGYTESSTRGCEVSSEQVASDDNHVCGDASTVSDSCLLGLVILLSFPCFICYVNSDCYTNFLLYKLLISDSVLANPNIFKMVEKLSVADHCFFNRIWKNFMPYIVCITKTNNM